MALLVVLILTVGATPSWAAIIDDPDSYIPPDYVEMPADLSPGDSGAWVYRLQKGLADAGFRPGPFDGRFGRATLGAVYAFQKVHDLPRESTFDTAQWDLLDVEPSLPPAEVDPVRVEVDLERQVLFLVRDHQVQVTLPISSGNGGTFTGRAGTPVRARTPEGSFRFGRHIGGWRTSYLGDLYYPFYFYGGYAIHGSWSVPPYPASHGCVRVEIHDMNYLRNELRLGMPVYIYGNRLDRSDLLPIPLPEPKQVVVRPGQPTLTTPTPVVN
jgi:peptidoglycan hydrolase-like protein with peptidoglycan-binding domain